MSCRPGIGVGAFVLHEGQLLMQQRGGPPSPLTWSCPGGWQEAFEAPWQTAARECLEETGVIVEPSQQAMWVSDNQFPEQEPPHHHTVTIWVSCKYISGIPTVQEPIKCPQTLWVPTYKVASLNLFLPVQDLVNNGII